MLRVEKNIPSGSRMTNQHLYGKLKRISSTIAERRMKLAGHVHRDTSSPAHLTVIWQPTHGNAGRGRPPVTLLDTLLRDTQLDNVAELESCMLEH